MNDNMPDNTAFNNISDKLDAALTPTPPSEADKTIAKDLRSNFTGVPPAVSLPANKQETDFDYFERLNEEYDRDQEAYIKDQNDQVRSEVARINSEFQGDPSARATQAAGALLKVCAARSFYSLDCLGQTIPKNQKPKVAYYPVWSQFLGKRAGRDEHPDTIFVMILLYEGKLLPRIVHHVLSDWRDGPYERTSTNFNVLWSLEQAQEIARRGHTLTDFRALNSRCFEAATKLYNHFLDKNGELSYVPNDFTSPGVAYIDNPFEQDPDLESVARRGSIAWANKMGGTYTGD